MAEAATLKQAVGTPSSPLFTASMASTGEVAAGPTALVFDGTISAVNFGFSPPIASTTGAVVFAETSVMSFSKMDGASGGADVRTSVYDVEALEAEVDMANLPWADYRGLQAVPLLTGDGDQTWTDVAVSASTKSFSGRQLAAMLSSWAQGRQEQLRTSGVPNNIVMMISDAGTLKCPSCSLSASPLPTLTVDYYEICRVVTVANGQVSVSPVTGRTQAAVGDSLVVTCSAGYTLTGSVDGVILCTDTGSYDPPLTGIACEAARPPASPPPPPPPTFVGPVRPPPEVAPVVEPTPPGTEFADVTFFLEPSTSPLGGGVEMTMRKVPDGAAYCDPTKYEIDVYIFAPGAQPVLLRDIEDPARGGEKPGIVFISPASNETGYVAIDIVRRAKGTEQIIDVHVLPSLLNYVDHDCILPGYVFFDGSCKPCVDIEGAYCPGGARMWPLDGYWAASEDGRPTKCRVASSCPGAVGSAGVPPQQTVTGKRRTATCQARYTGTFCAQCAAGYSMDNGVCRSCGGATASYVETALAGVGLVAVIVLLALSQVLLSRSKFALVLFTLLCLQNTVFAVRLGFQAIDDGEVPSWLPTAVRMSTLILFDLEALRHGCAVPPMSYPSLYMASLCIGALVPLAAVVLRYTCLRSRKVAPSRASTRSEQGVRERASTLGESMASPSSIFINGEFISGLGSSSSSDIASGLELGYPESGSGSSIGAHSLVVEEQQENHGGAGLTHLDLAALDSTMRDVVSSWESVVGAVFASLIAVFLPITARTAQGLMCVRAGDGELRLAADLSVVCFDGTHGVMAVVLVPMAAFFCLGLPLWSTVVVVRTIRRRQVARALRSRRRGCGSE
ncbi:uncharacterized protein AMSG_07471 [Thecamonas trahens ATCC 50062]|uniref:Sushi domain-containing protein n=1 Tax=Thecamonas trahens ATCC 50062 TaxID=461836 RepID=A0A0L0DHJ8_THETB|nr:hypothetical protein AMSG_07471 [Thecamonas trahens ATCC 50062]KNC51571.1 hypothetical protein AMSG_07471 [Thecamonas trahens ATCC 50062]|eukprot:XP_013755973.1 hypothetical protein AMSG_07471 [Thecamonas trahens ATCC 50062]